MTSPLTKSHLPSLPPRTIGRVSIQSAPLPQSSTTVHRVTIQPGGSWSQDLKPHSANGEESCGKTHAGVVLKGKLGVRMMGGGKEEEVYGEGDAFGVAPGHDAWCVGEGEVVFVEWSAS